MKVATGPPSTVGNVSTPAPTVQLYNHTTSVNIAVGSSATPFVIDPASLKACCNMGPPLAVYARLNVHGSTGNSGGGNLAQSDAMLLGQHNAYPTLSAYSEFDVLAWQRAASKHEILTLLSSSTDLYFIGNLALLACCVVGFD
jgi:hypothetical protein